MTLVCVRLDNSFGMTRLTALADTRVSTRRDDGTFKTLSDTTTKLFALPVRCYRADALSPVIGAWSDPYFETQIGLGFAGSCFEALTIIAHLGQALSALVCADGSEPIPAGDGLVHLLKKKTEIYFKHHSDADKCLVRMLVFGFDGSRPWVGRIAWEEAQGISSTFEWAGPDTLKSIGQDGLAEQYAGKLMQQIRQRRAKTQAKVTKIADPDVRADKEQELATLDLAEKHAAEDAMLDAIKSDFQTTIGGVLQRMDLGFDGDRIVAGFTQDDRPYLAGGNYSVVQGSELGPISIFEKMGRSIRTA